MSRQLELSLRRAMGRRLGLARQRAQDSERRPGSERKSSSECMAGSERSNGSDRTQAREPAQARVLSASRGVSRGHVASAGESGSTGQLARAFQIESAGAHVVPLKGSPGYLLSIGPLVWSFGGGPMDGFTRCNPLAGVAGGGTEDVSSGSLLWRVRLDGPPGVVHRRESPECVPWCG